MGSIGALGGWAVVGEILKIRERNRKEREWDAKGLPPGLRPGGDGGSG